MNKGFTILVLLFCFCIKTVTLQCQVAQVCVHDRSVDECWIGQVLVPGGAVFGCCPACGTATENPEGVDPGICQAPSNCLPDGKYAPVQCKGDQFTGRCFCSDENGKRIFGQMRRREASEMSCGCSRRRAQLESSEKRVVTLHCTTSGDYEPLQCDDGMCWCAQPKTGQPTVIPVPEADMKRLPCYTAAVIGAQYLRQCESLVLATAAIAQQQAEHGTNFLGNPVTFCDYDGTYGPYQIQNGIAYCTGRNGSILGAWQTVSSEMNGMTCNCARDTAIYFPEIGMMVTETCQGNGNYRPNQNVADVYYCVDADGYPVTEFSEAWPSDNCASYANT